MISIDFVLDGLPLSVSVESDSILLDVLREELGNTSAKAGCRVGYCGACTVLLDDSPIHACSTLALQVHGRRVDTSLSDEADIRAAQACFTANGASQCGFCIPGFVLSAVGAARLGRQSDVHEYLEGNLCRCGVYRQIQEAVRAFVTEDD